MVEARLGAGVWDILVCEDCSHSWSGNDVNYEWTDDPEQGEIHCPNCESAKVTREERG